MTLNYSFYKNKYLILPAKSTNMYRIYYGNNKFYFVKKHTFCMCREFEQNMLSGNTSFVCEHLRIINENY